MSPNAANQEDAVRREKARQNLALLQEKGAKLQLQPLQQQLLELKPTTLLQVNFAIKPIADLTPRGKLPPIALEVFAGLLFVGYKSGELSGFQMCDQYSQLVALEAGTPLRGPVRERKHKYCAKNQTICPPSDDLHSGPAFIVQQSQGLLAVGGGDCLVNFYSYEKGSLRSNFTVAFKARPQLSASTAQYTAFAEGQRLRVFAGNCEINTFYGPTDEITGVFALATENAVICSCEDKSLRFFDLNEFSQLVYVAHQRLHCCCAVSGEVFITGGSEHIEAFRKDKKESQAQIRSAGQPICAHAVQGYGCFVVGFRDCAVVYRAAGDKIEEVQRIPVEGFVNSVKMYVDGRKLNLAIAGGREKAADRFEVLRCRSFIKLFEIGSIDPVQIKKKGRFEV